MESQPNKISAGISRVENNNDMKETGEKEIDDSTEIVHFIFLMEKITVCHSFLFSSKSKNTNLNLILTTT